MCTRWPNQIHVWYMCMYNTCIPYFLEISPRRHLISWSSLARRHFEGGQISRAATKVLVTLLYIVLWASVRIVRYLESMSIYITYVRMRAIMTTLCHMRREFEGGV